MTALRDRLTALTYTVLSRSKYTYILRVVFEPTNLMFYQSPTWLRTRAHCDQQEYFHISKHPNKRKRRYSSLK